MFEVFRRRFRRQQYPRWVLPEPLPVYPQPFCVLKYADRAADVVLVHGQYPVFMRQVDRYGNTIRGAGERQFDDHDSLLGYGRRMDNIVPGASWALRFAA